jgi:hypothetical protein
MPLVVEGQVHHRAMHPDKVHAILGKQFPGLLVRTPEVSVDLVACRVEFFFNVNSITDFTVTTKSVPKQVMAATPALARDSHNINLILLKALGRPFQRARVKSCFLKDERSGGNLLHWVRDESPMKSRPAILSYVLCLALLVIAGILVHGLFRQTPSDSRNYNILSLILAITLPAITLPLPFVYAQLESRKGRWTYAQNEGGS